MPIPILQTKLYTPPPRPDLVPRPRLLERLNAGLPQKLTLISAPAGFGKTTVVSAWIASAQDASSWSTAWLSLNEDDNDLTRFLGYLIAALQTLPVADNANPFGTDALTLLQSPQPPPLENILTTLLNDTAIIPEKFLLVLDDYHVLINPEIDKALSFLLDYSPPHMHLVITSREDPNLPLARYRVRSQLTELRAADLRFTATEAAEFLNSIMGLHLSTEEIAELETRTEGWIAGLQMAALSLQGRSDSTDFIQAFTGSHRFVLDYLAEEVLQSQSESVRGFLLQTAILDRLSASLCDAVTGRDDGKEVLAMLERANLFVIPLDEQRQWYRYHHLFAEVLQARLIEKQSDQLPTLHRRASDWYERNGMRTDAIHHALAAADFEWSAELIELAWRAMDRSLQSATWLGWVQALPDEVVRARPVLSLGYAWALLSCGELEASEVRLRDAERWLDPAPASGLAVTKMVVIDEEEFRLLPVSIASARAYRAQSLGDMPGTVTYAQQALDLLPEDDHLGRAIPAGLLGIAYWASGDLEAAYQSFADSMAGFQMTGNIIAGISGIFGLADIRITQGRLYEAIRIYEQALQFALSNTNANGVSIAAQGEPAPQGTAILYLGLSELNREQGNTEAAAEYLLKSKELGAQAGQELYQYRVCLAQARIEAAQGDFDGALDLINEAEHLYKWVNLPDLYPVAALKTRVWVQQGRLTNALGWVSKQGLSVDDDLSYLHEFEHVTLARVLIAQYKSNQDKSDRTDGPIQQAIGLLERLLRAAEAGQRMGSVIEILYLQALAYDARGEMDLAIFALERALTLAEPEGYVRTFVDEGEPMMRLLQAAAEHKVLPDYVSNLLAAFERTKNGAATQPSPSQPSHSQPSHSQPSHSSLIEPLSEREIDVLRLLRTELSGPEIANELMVSLNTMRTHSKNIYSKLGVNNRRAAIRRAEELGLF